MSEWTIDTLKELWDQWKVAHEHVHKMEHENLDTAASDVNRRLEGMNQLRSQIESERGKYLLRDLYDGEHKALSDAVDARLKILENKASNLEGRLWAVGGAIGLVVVAVQIVLHFLSSK